jgi:hypothetical protein
MLVKDRVNKGSNVIRLLSRERSTLRPANAFLETFENYQTGTVSNQLTDVGRGRVCWGEILIVCTELSVQYIKPATP